jgi:pyrimidine operon attenuation protein/uracil phosphoribosyltransferase
MSAENSTVTQVFLGIIAMATLLMALVQVGFIIYGWTIARRVSKMLDRIEHEMTPVLEGLSAMARDAARASSLALVQVERVDRLFTDLTTRIEETATTVQRVVLTPLREGAALMAGIKALLSVLRNVSRPGSATSTEDEDTLFIG